MKGTPGLFAPVRESVSVISENADRLGVETLARAFAGCGCDDGGRVSCILFRCAGGMGEACFSEESEKGKAF